MNTGGTLDLNGNDLLVGNFTGTGGTVVNNATGTSKTLTIGNNNGTGGNYAGVIADNTSGTGTIALTKTGSGTLTLSGPNTYSQLTQHQRRHLEHQCEQQSGNASATNTISIAGGTLQNTGAAVALGTNRTVVIGAGGGTLMSPVPTASRSMARSADQRP